MFSSKLVTILKLKTMKKAMTIIATIALFFFTSCSKTGMQTGSAKTISQTNSTKGIGSAIPAYYDSMLLKIIFVEFSSTAEANLIAHNNSLNFIYRSDPGLPNNQPFISVIDAVPGDGMNPVWREVQIAFNPGFTPRQLFSDNAVLAAASGPNPEISLDMKNEVYWCPIVGTK
jgi:hypothetical protein